MADTEPKQWATITDVAALTRVTVDETTRLQAVASIEVLVGLIEAVPRVDISDRDLYFLKQAVCFQAAWIDAQPDFLERNDVSSASQTGQSATGGSREWLVLSPLARKAIKRLSWRGPRDLAVLSPGKVGSTTDPDVLDDRLPWRPL